MRVVIVNRFFHPDHSATSLILSDLAVGLVRRGLDIHVIASRQRYGGGEGALARGETWQGIGIHRVAEPAFARRHLATRLLGDICFHVLAAFALWRLLRKGDVAVVMTDPPLASLSMMPPVAARGARQVNWVQDIFPEVLSGTVSRHAPSRLLGALKRLRNLSFRRAACNVVISDRMQSLLLREGIPAERMLVIPNWAVVEEAEPIDARSSRLRAVLGLEDAFVVGYAGNLGRAHDALTIFKAATLLAADTSIAFVIQGGGHGHAQLREWVSGSGLANIRFLPYQPLDGLADAMALANLHLVTLQPQLEGLVVPSKFYGIAAAARPIGFIGDFEGELAQLIRRHRCGFAVNQGDPKALASRIRALARDGAEAQTQGRRARQLLESRFAKGSAHGRWYDLLLSLGT